MTAPAPDQGSLRERSILIVDADHDVVDLLADLLDEEGYRVRAAGDEEEAFRQIAREPPDLLVADVNMPEVEGATLTKQLRARGLGMPVVLLSTAYADVDVPDVQFVPKPFDLEYIIEVIARIFTDLGR
jgi:two-component system nitrogen regulation response regulator NtrX